MSEPVLRTENLTKRFGGLTAVDNLSFSLAGGAVNAIIGPNGAGKTTFFNLVSGLLSPSSGRIFFRGRDITGCQPHAISRSRHQAHAADQERISALTRCGKSLDHTACRAIASSIRSGRPRAIGKRETRSRQTLEQIGLAASPRVRPARFPMAMSRCSRSAWH